jgi:hypothetical protein
MPRCATKEGEGFPSPSLCVTARIQPLCFLCFVVFVAVVALASVLPAPVAALVSVPVVAMGE